MYIPNLENLKGFELDHARAFVEFWGRFYEEDTTKVRGSEVKIDYLRELNLGNDLTDENVRRLLRWKDHQHLTDVVMNGPNTGKANSTVSDVLQHRNDLNAFRTGRMDQAKFRALTEEIFATGIVFRAFLCHICRPQQYPIIDRYVRQVFVLHTGGPDADDWDTYDRYTDYFFKIATRCGFEPRTDTEGYIRDLKQIDNALFAFGQFLEKYVSQ
jgi:hypothetical protein